MKNILLLLAALAICQITISQNGLYIATGGSLDTENGRITVVNGHVKSTSSTGLNGGTLQMKSLDGNDYDLELTESNTLTYLELYGSGTINFDGQVTLGGELFFNDTSKFNLTKGSHVTLLPNAEIVSESNINTITGADGTYIKTTQNHTAGVTNDFGLIGVEVRNGATSMGSTEVFRKYGTITIDGNPTAKRYYEVVPTNNVNLDLDVRFYLLDTDLNGLARNNIAAFRSTDNGATFTNRGGTANTYYHEVSKLDAFSIWAFADASTLSMDDYDSNENAFSIFPNPASHIVTLHSNKNQVITSVELYDITGKKMIIALRPNVNVLNVFYLSDGIYFLRILSENSSVTKKLVVEK